MLVQVTLMLAAAALGTAQYGAPPPPLVLPVGTDITIGNMDLKRTPVKGIPDIPKEKCHTVIPRSKYDCGGWSDLGALRVQARAESRNPPKIRIEEHFDFVTINGCGPIKLLVEHGCAHTRRY